MLVILQGIRASVTRLELKHLAGASSSKELDVHVDGMAWHGMA